MTVSKSSEIEGVFSVRVTNLGSIGFQPVPVGILPKGHLSRDIEPKSGVPRSFDDDL
jgi:hypothetical protein